ncbi:MAG: LytR/AlgR family response regulator transcription factor [Lachnospiraceae bacterium]
MTIKVILVDDEAGIRMLLRKIIEKQEAFEIVGESDNLADAVTLFTKTQAEVVFLDIDLNGVSGLECAKIISDLNPKAKIIFATAHTQYMPEAFKVYAFDYLVKPFDVERVKGTLERIRGLYPEETGQQLSCQSGREKGQDRLLIKGKESASFVETADIVLIQREEGNTVIYTAEDVFTTSVSMGELEAKLDPQLFMRSHKSYIINVSKIKRIEPYGRWTYVVIFQNLKKDALITAEKYEELKKRYN